jgi:3-deoxy-D-manno-octulosonic acid kinase
VRLPTPRGFTRFRAGRAHAVAHEAYAPWARGVLDAGGTLYEWARAHPDRRELPGGRIPAYAVAVPDASQNVVVRHSQHGGLLAPIRGDLFLPPTRAPYELLVSYVLANAGVHTPPVIAFAVYQAGLVLRRSDVVTLELPGQNLGEAFLASPEATRRASWIDRLARLMQALSRAGAWHPDLNVRNILLVPDGSGAEEAYLLDVDRIRFAPPGDPHVGAANLDRLERSVRKWRALHRAGFDDEELRALRARASEAPGA